MSRRWDPLTLLSRIRPAPPAPCCREERVGARGVFLLLLWLFVALAPRVQAADPAPVSTDELERLVQSLQDDTAREKLAEQLRALIAAQRGTEKEKRAGTAFVNQVTQQVEAFSGEILA